MPPRRKSALEELIRTGLVSDGELLRYKSKQGQLMAVGRAREGGIEVEGVSKLLGYTAFEDVAGSRYHRPAEHTHTLSGRNLQGLALLAAADGGGGGGSGGGGGGRGRHAAQQAEPAVELLEDENDDLCHVCGLGGDLMCCETCPAVFHAACLGLAAPPPGDFYCTQCRCTVCGEGGTEGLLPTGCQFVGCDGFSSLEGLQQLPRPHIGPPAAAAPAQDKAAEGQQQQQQGAAAGGEPMQVDGEAAAAAAGEQEEGLADFGSLLAAATAEVQATAEPSEVREAAPAAEAAARAASGKAAVPCPVTLRWGHLQCFPPEFAEQLRQHPSQPCISSQEAATASARLAAACSAGLIPLGSIAEGARASGVPAAAAAADGGGGSSGGGGSGGVDARAPLPVSLLVVRGAAAAAPATCRGHAPAYTEGQREQLQGALSAALHVLHSVYEPVPDSRTGADLLPWLVRGAVLSGGEADYSGVHTALLYLGPAVAAVAVFRCFGRFAELPLLAVRPELQRRNGLGRLLLAAVERLLLTAGAQWLLTPGFTAAGYPYLPHPAPAEGQPAAAPAPELLQAKWGYSLAPAQLCLDASQHPLVRIPGVLLACKQLSPEAVLAPPRLPRRLQWSGAVADTRQLLRDGMLSSVAPAPAAPPAAAAAPAKPAGGAVAAAAAAAAAPGKPKPGRPPKAPPAPAAAGGQGAPTLQAQQAVAAQQQQMLALMQQAREGSPPVLQAAQQQLAALVQAQQAQQAAFLQRSPEQYARVMQQQQAALAQLGAAQQQQQQPAQQR